MRKPLIGITPDYDPNGPDPMYKCHRAYCDAITRAGGIPILLPYLDDADADDFLSSLSGFVLTVGIDFAPELYGGEHSARLELIDPDRDRFEIATINYARANDIPHLGICRGMQLMNVLSGGDIFQHTLDSLPDALEHRPPGFCFHTKVHDIIVEPDSKLGEIYNGRYRFAVNSVHHQAVNRIGAGLKVTARAEDGVVEALEDPSASFAIGVEWHPEHMLDTDQSSLELFEAFVQACAQSDQHKTAAAE